MDDFVSELQRKHSISCIYLVYFSVFENYIFRSINFNLNSRQLVRNTCKKSGECRRNLRLPLGLYIFVGNKCVRFTYCVIFFKELQTICILKNFCKKSFSGIYWLVLPHAETDPLLGKSFYFLFFKYSVASMSRSTFLVYHPDLP